MPETKYDRIPVNYADTLIKTLNDAINDSDPVKRWLTPARLGTSFMTRVVNVNERGEEVYSAGRSRSLSEPLSLVRLERTSRSREGSYRLDFIFASQVDGENVQVITDLSDLKGKLGYAKVDHLMMGVFGDKFEVLYDTMVSGPEVTPDGVVVSREPAQNLERWGTW